MTPGLSGLRVTSWDFSMNGQLCFNTPNTTRDALLRMCLSRVKPEGLHITVYSFNRLARESLNTPAVQYFLGEKLSQDPLEGHFSKQRGCGGCSNNPTVGQFAHNELSLYVTMWQEQRPSPLHRAIVANFPVMLGPVWTDL